MLRIGAPRCAVAGLAVMATAPAGLAGGPPPSFVNWLAASDGAWSMGDQWSGGVSPNNGPGGTFFASISVVGAPFTVTLDVDVELDGLSLTSPDATLDVTTRSLTLGTTGSKITGGSIVGAAGSVLSAAGEIDLAGASLTGALRAEFAGGATVNSTSFTGLESGSFGGERTAFGGSVSIVNTSFTLDSVLTEICDGDFDVCDSDIGHDRRRLQWNGDAVIRLESVNRGASLNFGAESLFEITGTGNRTLTATGPDSVIRSGGRVVVDLTPAVQPRGPALGLMPVVSITGAVLENTGVVEAMRGMLSTDGVALGAGNTLSGGTWLVGGEGGIDLVGQTVERLDGGAMVMLDGAGSVFGAVDGSVREVLGGSTLGVTGARDIELADGFTLSSGGGVTVGAGSAATVVGTFTNVAGGTFSGGVVNLGGDLLVRDAMNAVTDAFAGLEAIGSDAVLGLIDGRGLGVVGNLTVGGEVALGAGGVLSAAGSVLSVGGDYRHGATGTLRVSLADAASFGVVDVAGAFIIGDGVAGSPAGRLVLDLGGFSGGTTDVTFISAAGGVFGAFAEVVVENAGAGVTVDVSIGEFGVGARVTVVPGPGSVAVLSAAGLIVARRRRGRMP